VLVGNCAFFVGKPFTYDVDSCRALGNTLEFAYTGGEQNILVNSTLYGQGDGLVAGGPREAGDCNGSETLTAWNNVFLEDTECLSPDDITFLFYQEGCADLKMDSDYNIAHTVKNVECSVNGTYVNSGDHDLCQDPELTGPFSGNAYGMRLTASSPAIDAGTADGAPPDDFDGCPRDATPDIDAYEWRPREDVDCDDDMDTDDVQAVAETWGCDGDCPRGYDQDNDGDVNIVDVQRVASVWSL